MYLLLLLTVISWGGSWPAGSIVAHALPALFAAFLRYSIALPFFLLSAYLFEKRRFKEDIKFFSLKTQGHLFILGLFQITLYNMLFFTGLKYTSSSDATLIIASNPTITAIFASLLYQDEKLTRTRLLGLFIALSGVFLIVMQSPNLDVQNRLLGDIIILAAALIWAMFTVFARPMLRIMYPLTFTAIVTFYGWILLFISAYIVDTEQFDINVIYQLDSKVIYAIFFMAIFAAVMSNTFFNKGIEVIGPSRTAVFVNMVPVFGIIFSILLLGDNFSMFYIMAFFLILAGVMIVNRK